MAGLICRLSVRTDPQYSVCRCIPGPSRPHRYVYRNCTNDELCCFHHVWQSACHSAHPARVMHLHKHALILRRFLAGSYLVVVVVSDFDTESNVSNGAVIWGLAIWILGRFGLGHFVHNWRHMPELVLWVWLTDRLSL